MIWQMVKLFLIAAIIATVIMVAEISEAVRNSGVDFPTPTRVECANPS